MPQTLAPPAIPGAARKGQTWGGPPALRGPASARVDQMINEPSAIVGMNSGQTQAIVGEPTPEYPQGQPERMTITNADGEQGPLDPALEGQDPATAEVLITGFRNLLKSFAGEGPPPAKRISGPQAYASGGVIGANGKPLMVGPAGGGYGTYGSTGSSSSSSFIPAPTPSTGARSAYLAEQQRVSAQREAARRALDAQKPSEQQRVTDASEDYKFALGGLARPKTAYELASESEDQADAYRQFGLERFGFAAENESLANSIAANLHSNAQGAASAASRSSSRGYDDEDADEMALAQEELEYQQRIARTPVATRSRPVKPLFNGGKAYYASGGSIAFNAAITKRNAGRLADANDNRARARLQRSKDIDDEIKDRRTQERQRLQDQRQDANDARTEARQRRADERQSLADIRAAEIDRRQDESYAESRSKAKADPRFKYSKDSLGRYTDDEILDMEIKGVFGKNERGQGRGTAALRARGYTQDEIDDAWRYAMTKGKKTGASIGAASIDSLLE